MDKRIWDKLWRDKHEKRCNECDKIFVENIIEQFKRANIEGKHLYVLYTTDDSEPYWTVKCGEMTGYNVDNSIDVNVVRPPQPDGNFLLVGVHEIIRHPSNIFRIFTD